MRVFTHHALTAANPDLNESLMRNTRDRRSAADQEDQSKKSRPCPRQSEYPKRPLRETLDQVKAGMTETQSRTHPCPALFADGRRGSGLRRPCRGLAITPPAPCPCPRRLSNPAGRCAADLDFGAKARILRRHHPHRLRRKHATDEAQSVYDTVLRANLRGPCQDPNPASPLMPSMTP